MSTLQAFFTNTAFLFTLSFKYMELETLQRGSVAKGEGRQDPRESKARPVPPPPEGAQEKGSRWAWPAWGGPSRRALSPGARVAEPRASRCSGNTEEMW